MPSIAELKFIQPFYSHAWPYVSHAAAVPVNRRIHLAILQSCMAICQPFCSRASKQKNSFSHSTVMHGHMSAMLLPCLSLKTFNFFSFGPMRLEVSRENFRETRPENVRIDA